jgi:hypothetical protein
LFFAKVRKVLGIWNIDYGRLILELLTMLSRVLFERPCGGKRKFSFSNGIFHFFLDEKTKQKNQDCKSKCLLSFIIPKCGRGVFEQVLSLSVLLRTNFTHPTLLFKVGQVIEKLVISTRGRPACR